jgi:hypothetical protein
MSDQARRDFLKHGALAAAGLGSGTWLQSADAQGNAGPARGPDLVLVNGVVFTIDPARPQAQAFAVKHGRFTAVGSNDEVRPLAVRGTQVIDAAGMTVVPGFIDAHTHPGYAGVRELLWVNCDRNTIDEIKEAIRQRAAQTPAGQWIFGFKYDDTKVKDGRPLHRRDLDAVAPNHPVRVEHRGGHTGVYSSLAFKLAGVDDKTPDPSGGRFGRDAKGELTGFVAERAKDPFDKVGRPPTPTPRQQQEAVTLMSRLMTAAGLTSVHDVLASKEDFIAYQESLAAGELLFRVYILFQAQVFPVIETAGVRRGFGNEHLRVGGIKLFCDGSASERTMRMSQPYVGRPNDFGILVVNQEQLNEQVMQAHAAGYHIGTHANGDVAIDMVLRAYELALRAHPRPDARLRIEHCTLVNPDLLRRIATIGAIPAPFYTYVYYHGDKWVEYGEERTRWMFAHRSFLDHKIRVAGASDYVPGPYEPMMAIQSMVTRKDHRGRVWGANQRISVDEALQVCTINGAHASFEERIKGSITEGKLADFVILADDPHKVDPDRIKDIRIVRTVVGGRTVHPAP